MSSIQIPKWMTEYNPPTVAQSINMSNPKPAEALHHNEDLEKVTGCPNPDCNTEASLWSIIIHVNDEHKWSREDIADWLDSLPNQPTFYPDIRTDDEKIEDYEKKQKKLPWANPSHNVMNDIQAWKSEFVKSVAPTNYIANIGGSNVGGTCQVTLPNGTTLAGKLQSIEVCYKSYGGTEYQITFGSW